jgi:hypothetical protein
VNRFSPDTLRDALWRPVAMAVPDAGLYVEILAPDIRFAMLLVLMVLTALFALRHKRAPGFSPTWLLIAFTWIAFVPWLLTTGNGRYFIPVLLLSGPLVIALIHKLPMTAAFRVSAALIVIGVQAFAVAENNPFGRWPLAPWAKPYFDVALGEEEKTRPAAYVTISSISYSLIAPQFAPGSRWISVASLPGDPERNVDDRRAHAFLRGVAATLPLRVIAPTIPDQMDSDGQPNGPIRAEMNRILTAHGMRLVPGTRCKMLRSQTITAMAKGDNAENFAVHQGKYGFWICDLQFPVERPRRPVEPEDQETARVFARVERACPRIFPPGEGVSKRVEGGVSRAYPSSDMKAYVLENGDVLYKYWRSLNPGRIGSTQEVLAENFRMDCNSIRGRSGLPWEKQI